MRLDPRRQSAWPRSTDDAPVPQLKPAKREAAGPSLAPRPTTGADVMPKAAAATIALIEEVAVIHELADLGASSDARVAAKPTRTD